MSKRGRPRLWTVYTDSCSGCCELGENMSLAHNYPFDKKANCHIGMGCRECGYTGKRRHYMSHVAMAEDMGMTLKEFNELPDD